ncbi:MAG: hypothetical protein HC857_15030 [Synechococcales cyanobacterium RU_4_20]|nr:hypothetical protein [Synechococcales cyanobacterium RU_4_20]
MEQPGSPSPWATVRFRRAKDVRGWTLLGIPTLLYVQVLEQLFERQARFIEKHHQGEFVSVLFEAPVALAAHLALRFPAPADSEVLSVNAGGDRILHGKAATSAKAQHQAKATGPSLAELARQDAFWEAVRSLASSNPSQNPSQNDQPNRAVGRGRRRLGAWGNGRLLSG